MKYFLLLFFLIPAAVGQTVTATISGSVLDARTQKPIPAALVTALRNGPPPLSRNTKSGGDGAFQIQGLAGGQYSLCAQAPGNEYLDPCQWNGSPTTVTVASGQAVTGIAVRLAAAALVIIQVQDPQRVLSQNSKDGRRPDLAAGVWGPNGLYHPARAVEGPAAGATPRVESAAIAIKSESPGIRR